MAENDAMWATMLNQNSMNNPNWLIWAMLFGGNGGFYGGRGGVQDIQFTDRLNNIQSQIASNQQTNVIGAEIKGNHELLHSIAGGQAMGFAGVNANILNQTSQLQQSIDRVNTSVERAASNLGFLTQSQTNELSNVMNANTQRILDKMCSDTTQGLRDRIAELSQSAQTATIISELKDRC